MMTGENLVTAWECKAREALVERDYRIDLQCSVIRIYTAAGLAWFAKCVNDPDEYPDGIKSGVLEEDVDLSGREWMPIGCCEDAPFRGNFDGQRHIIKGLTISGSFKLSGFFGCVRGEEGKERAKLRDICLEGVDIDCWGKAGALAGTMEYTQVDGCSSAGSVISGNEAGGIAAYMCGCVMKDTYSVANVKSLGLDAGGLAACMEKCILEYCFSPSEVRALACAGGITAVASECLVSGCFASGKVWGAEAPGGLVGIIKKLSRLEYCYTTVHVICLPACWENCVGGLLGQNYASFDVEEACQVKNCYAASVVEGKSRFLGAFSGSAFDKMPDCRYDKRLNPGLPATGRRVKHKFCTDIPVPVEPSGWQSLSGWDEKWLAGETYYPQLRYFACHPNPAVRNMSGVSVQNKWPSECDTDAQTKGIAASFHQ